MGDLPTLSPLAHRRYLMAFWVCVMVIIPADKLTLYHTLPYHPNSRDIPTHTHPIPSILYKLARGD